MFVGPVYPVWLCVQPLDELSRRFGNGGFRQTGFGSGEVLTGLWIGDPDSGKSGTVPDIMRYREIPPDLGITGGGNGCGDGAAHSVSRA
jgi:hypothetical protein